MDKSEFYNSLPKNGKVAEIGVLTGENAKIIKSICDPSLLVLIDFWDTISEEENMTHFNLKKPNWAKVFGDARFKFLDDDQVFFLAGKSDESSKLFSDGYFDWVFVDASHSYEGCMKDLVAWLPKVRSGGFLCGHDYFEDDFTRKKGWGVKQAVDEFIAINNLTIEFTSNERAVRYAIRVR